jgi:hypothetical protein
MTMAARYKEGNEIADQMKEKIGLNNQYYVRKTECFYYLKQTDSLLENAKRIDDVFDYSFWRAVVNNDKAGLKKDFESKQAVYSIKNDGFGNYEKARYNVFLKEYDEAINNIEAGFKAREFSWLKFLNVSPEWSPLKREARFNNILEKLGF